MQPSKKTEWGKKFVDNPTSDSQNKFFIREVQANKRAIMLDIELKNGDHIAMPYAYLTKIKYNLSEGILIEWGATSIKIEGSNLKELYNHLVQHKVKLIKDSVKQVNNDIPDDVLFIEKISVVQSF